MTIIIAIGPGSAILEHLLEVGQSLFVQPVPKIVVITPEIPVRAVVREDMY